MRRPHVVTTMDDSQTNTEGQPSSGRAESYFVQISYAELDLLQGDPRALQVWACLLRFASWDSGKCFPSKKTIAGFCGCSVDSVERALKRLKIEKLLKITPRKNPTGDNQTNEYQ